MTDASDRPSPLAVAPTDPGARRSPARKIALLGLPNSGKSQIFNRLTGQYALVANYPMTTVTAERKPALIGLHWYEVVDTPGLHGLTIHAQEELEVRELLYRERPDVIVQCVDANRLKSSLSLTADLLELEIPLVVALNAIDETTRRGVEIDARLLGERLGVQVVELVAAKGLGTGQLKRAITGAAPGIHQKRYGELLEEGLENLARWLPDGTPYPRKTALTLAVGDPFLLRQLGRWNPSADPAPLERELAAVRNSLKANPVTAAASVRNRWIDAIADEVIRTRPPPRSDWSRRAAEISRHPVLGAPVLLGIMALCFLLVVQVANRLTDLLNTWVWIPVAERLDGVLPPGLWHDLLLGEFGLLSFGVANALLTVLPILSVFFFAYSLIEDTGYIPNMGVMTHRALRKLGLSGASIMPLVLACGCKTMATMTTRVLTSKKERLIAVFLIASSIPCAAQTGLHLAILGPHRARRHGTGGRGDVPWVPGVGGAAQPHPQGRSTAGVHPGPAADAHAVPASGADQDLLPGAVVLPGSPAGVRDRRRDPVRDRCGGTAGCAARDPGAGDRRVPGPAAADGGRADPVHRPPGSRGRDAADAGGAGPPGPHPDHRGGGGGAALRAVLQQRGGDGQGTGGRQHRRAGGGDQRLGDPAGGAGAVGAATGGGVNRQGSHGAPFRRSITKSASGWLRQSM